jgi:hypothetical protein
MFRWVLWRNCQEGVQAMPLDLRRVSSGDTSVCGAEVRPKGQVVFQAIEPVTGSMRLSTCRKVTKDATTARMGRVRRRIKGFQRRRRRRRGDGGGS